MPQVLRSTVGQFSSTGGRWQPRAANVRAVEPAADLPGAQRGSLYMLIEVSGSGGGHAALYRQLLSAAQKAFYELGENVEGALRQAVRSVHAELRRANEGVPEARWRAGMSLVVRYANQLIVAQAGPALVLVGHPHNVEQFPERWTPALGGEERAETLVYDAAIEPGSILFLAQSEWLKQVSPQALAVAAAASSVTGASQYLGQLAGAADLTALLVGFTYDVPEVRDESERGIAARTAGAPDAVRRPAPAAPKAHAPPPDTGRRGLFGGRRLLGLGRGGEERPRSEPGAAEEGASVPPADLAFDAPGGAFEPLPGPTSLSGDAEPGAHVPLQTPAARNAEPLAATPVAAPAATVVVPPVPSIWGHEAAVQAELAPEIAETDAVIPPTMDEAPARRSAWPLLLAVVVLPLLIIGVVVAMLLMRSRAADAQFTEKINGAANIITQAEAMTDEAAAAVHLRGADDYLQQAKVLRPNDSRLTEQQTRYDAIMLRVEHVTPLYGIVPLWDFKTQGRQLERVIVSGDSVFVLDRGRNVVNRFVRSPLGDSVTPATTEDKPLFGKGDTVGDKAVGDLLDMTWSPAASANQRSLLLSLDATGELIGYDVVYGVKRLTVGGKTEWGQAQLIAGYGGNLYVADAGKDQIWRYRPGATGYEGQPEPYFGANNQTDLAGLQAFAIDGNIWLLFSDGRLLKFFGGEQRSFAMQGLPTPLSDPVAVAVPQEGDRLYIADAGNSRIVEISKEGKFLRQFRAREGELRNMKYLYLDEAGGMFYILTADQLYKAVVPDPAQTTPPPSTPTS